MEIIEDYLSYNERLELRDPSLIDTVVLHCTELPTLAAAREFGERILYPETRTGASGHYYIDIDGAVYRYAEDARKARHVVGHNDTTLGIEIVNRGRYPNWFHAGHQKMTDPYLEIQISALKELLRYLRSRFPNLTAIARHSDLDTRWTAAEDDPGVLVRRRLDPGPMFPWFEIQSFWAAL